MENIIEVVIDKHYGTEHVYPTNSLGRKLIALLGTKTFTEDAIDKLEDIGFRFEEVKSNRFKV